MFFGILLFLYFVLFCVYLYSWRKIKTTDSMNYINTVSVIIACRNEENNVPKIVDCLKRQKFNNDKLELIFVNDHSQDNTLQLLINEQKKCSFMRVINLSISVEGKKNAVREGVFNSTGDIILCTDADCEMNSFWIQTMVNYFNNVNCRFISAPVVLDKTDSLFNIYQKLELLSLVTTSAAAIALNTPTLCSGANLGFRRNDYLEINPEEFKKFKTDDLSLLDYFKKNFFGSIFFVKDLNAIVYTSGQKSLNSYFSQKMRWISSSRYFNDLFIIFKALLVYTINLIICYSIIQFIYFLFFNFNLIFSIFYFTVVILKVLIDFFFLNNTLNFFKEKELLKYLFPSVIINSIITTVIVPLSFIYPLRWKGRKL